MPENGPKHLIFWFADDTLFLGEWSTANVKNLMRLLRCFHISSSLSINFSKSRVIGVGVSSQEVSSLGNYENCDSTIKSKYWVVLPNLWLDKTQKRKEQRMSIWIFVSTRKNWPKSVKYLLCLKTVKTVIKQFGNSQQTVINPGFL